MYVPLTFQVGTDEIAFGWISDKIGRKVNHLPGL